MMGILDGLLGGGGGGSPLDLYGDLFTPEQKAALQQRELSQGLFRMAEKLGQAAMPQRAPVSTLAALGQGLGAFGTGSDMTEQALKGMQVAEQVRESQRKRAALTSYQAIIEQGLRASGIDPKSPQGQQIVQQTLAGSPGAPTGGPPASNAPPPPPMPADVANIAGPPPLPTDVANIAGPAWPSPPGKQSGLLPPPPGANPQMGQGGGLLAGLPFDPGADGDNPDLSNIRIVPLSGEAAPAGDVPFPTIANPNTTKSAWQLGTTYDAPSRPYDPAVDRPANAAVGPEERGLLAGAKAPDTVIPPPRDNRSTLLDEIARRESGNRNIMQQLVPTTQSTAQGPWQITNQTWRDIAPKVGIDIEKYPTAMSVPPEVQRVVADRLLQERGTTPWKAMRVADTGGGPLATPSGAGALLATPSGAEARIPGINMTPTQLGLLNALGKIGGLDSPFSSLLETYYKSPGYLEQAAGAQSRGTLTTELELKPKLEAAIAWAKIDPNLNEYERKAQVDRYSDLLKQILTAQTSSKEVVVNVPGQPPEKQTLTNDQIRRLNSGEGVPERGLPPGTRLSEPYLTPEQTAAQTERGRASVTTDPNAFNITTDPRMLPKGPGTTEPAPLGNGVVLPPVNQASPITGSGDYLKARQKDWSDTENEWSKGVASSHLAEQRMQSIMTAMKSYQTGAYANELSDLRAKLKVVGITLPDSIAGDPALAQEMLKNNFAASVEAMKSSGLSRWTQAELFAAQKNIAQPNLQPAANLEIGAQSIGALRWERAMKDAWAEAKKYGWRDPQDFQSAFARANPVQNFVDQARQEIGPLKGMAQPPSPGTTLQPPPGGVRERRYNPATGKLE